jgi:hypothetical protein
VITLKGEPHTIATLYPTLMKRPKGAKPGGFWDQDQRAADALRARVYEFYYARKQAEEDKGRLPRGYTARLRAANAGQADPASSLVMLFKGIGISANDGDFEGVLEYTNRSDRRPRLPYESALGIEPRRRLEVRRYPQIHPTQLAHQGPDRHRYAPEIVRNGLTELTGDMTEINKLAALPDSPLSVAKILFTAAETHQYNQLQEPANKDNLQQLTPEEYGRLPERWLKDFYASGWRARDRRLPVRPWTYRIQCAKDPALMAYYQRKFGFREVTELPLDPAPTDENLYWRDTTAVMEIDREEYLKRILAPSPGRTGLWDAEWIANVSEHPRSFVRSNLWLQRAINDQIDYQGLPESLRTRWPRRKAPRAVTAPEPRRPRAARGR